MQTLEELQNQWLLKERNKIEKGKHKYLHIDQRLSTLDKDFVRDIWSPEKIIRHAFYPFALFHEKKFKYFEDPVTKKRYKKEKKPRPISYATHYDALIYSWYAFFINEQYEDLVEGAGISRNVIAYRSFPERKGNIEFAKEIVDFITTQPQCVVLNFDVEDFFGSIQHSFLKECWKKLIVVGNKLPADHFAVFKAVTRFSQFDLLKILKVLKIKEGEQRSKVRLCSPKEFREIIKSNPENLFTSNAENLKGIPQGAALSCVLSNLYMYQFDLIITDFVRRNGGLYRRYSDDIIVVVPPDLKDKIQELVVSELGLINLKISELKTEIHHISKSGENISCVNEEGKKSNLQYLGIEFNGKDVYLRHKGLGKFQAAVSRGVRQAVRKAVDINKGAVSKRSLYSKYSPKSKGNYLTYAKRARNSFNDSSTIKKQVSDKRIYKSINQKILLNQKKKRRDGY